MVWKRVSPEYFRAMSCTPTARTLLLTEARPLARVKVPRLVSVVLS